VVVTELAEDARKDLLETPPPIREVLAQLDEIGRAVASLRHRYREHYRLGYSGASSSVARIGGGRRGDSNSPLSLVADRSKQRVRAQTKSAGEQIKDALSRLKAAHTALDKATPEGAWHIGDPYKGHHSISDPQYQASLEAQKKRQQAGEE
jgi:hypothetical protein